MGESSAASSVDLDLLAELITALRAGTRSARQRELLCASRRLTPEALRTLCVGLRALVEAEAGAET